MDREERMYYLELSQSVGALLGIAGGITAAAYGLHEEYSNCTPLIIKGLLGGYVLGFTLPIGAMMRTRIVDNDWNDMKERARNLKRIFTLDDKV